MMMMMMILMHNDDDDDKVMMMILLSCNVSLAIHFMKNLLPFTETFKWKAMESIVGGHLRQMKDNLYSYISWSCHSSK